MTGPILIVDDSQTLRFSMQRMLSRLGWAALEAENGMDALAKLKGDTSIRLVLVDYNMPDLNGIDLIAAIHKQEPKRTIHCVIFTSIGHEAGELLEAAKAAGAVAWLTKPVQPEQIAELVQQFGR